ncbi:MAG: GNAT family N-acetyltransferase, partial [candidate division Zixibacteria bacterium]|nr:GNAT family N-acetyltransferase [candidate division Zixibacteria bacterium]
MTTRKTLKGLKFYPVTKNRWDDFEKLFGQRGACGGCWCMWWRLVRNEYDNQKGAGNKKAMRHIIESGDIPGILAYHNNLPIAWCSLAPRENYPALERSRILKRIDDLPVWSLVCFFIAKDYRHMGLSVRLLKEAKIYCKSRGGKILEGYPTEPRKDSMPDAFAWTGLASAFRKAGFKEVARRSKTRPIMR